MTKTLLFLVLVIAGCTGVPPGVTPVKEFRLESYLGRWYEVARLDHSFERGLTDVYADYSLRDDGAVKVLNRGYSPSSKKWKEAEGRASFVNGPDTGHLKVSFFGPFYGSYIIVDLDRDRYQYSLICGPDRSYLWILARQPKLHPDIIKRLVRKASGLGFNTDRLIFVDHHSPAALPTTLNKGD